MSQSRISLSEIISNMADAKTRCLEEVAKAKEATTEDEFVRHMDNATSELHKYKIWKSGYYWHPDRRD